MKKCILSAAAAFAAFAAFGIAASQAWVTNYVAKAIASSAAQIETTGTVVSTNGVTVYEVTSASGWMRLVVEDATDAALRATNCTASAVAGGVTNGTLFVWNGAGAYVNPSGTVSCTATNLVYSGVGSVRTNGVERFAGLFDAVGVLIQPSTSLSTTNGITEVGI